MKPSNVVSDGPYFKQLVTDELNRPNVFYSTAIDQRPLPKLRYQQLELMMRYFSFATKKVVVEHLQSFRLGLATADILLSETKKATQDLLQSNFICFCSGGSNLLEATKKKLKIQTF
uniref:WD repeat and HMGbox DNA binding protein 1 family protein n=1 Tax=Rhipicephalus appendiculatus TaxID=34631 RepID=A0A131YR75_RHIAP